MRKSPRSLSIASKYVDLSPFSRALAIFFLLLIIGLSSQAQIHKNPPFQPEMKPLIAHTSWIGRDGAPGNIAALAQTNDGYLWLGTPLGLYRFDGLQFASYPLTGLDTKLPSSDIVTLSSDFEGGLWIGYRIGGISHLSGDGTLTNYNLRNERGPNSAQKFIIQNDHSAWAVADNKLLVLRGERWENFGAQHGLPSDQLFSLFFDREGNLWTSTRHKLFVLYKGRRTFAVYPTKTFMVVDIGEMPNGQLWISDGWNSIRPLIATASQKAIPTDGYVRMLIDPVGTLWMAQDYRGLSYLPSIAPSTTSNAVVKQPDLSSEQTNVIMRDRDGDIWIGTSSGLDRLQSSALKMLSNIRVEYYPALASDPKGGVWVAALSHRILHSSISGFNSFGAEVGSSPIVCDDQSRLWLVDPIQNALTRYDQATVTRFPVPDDVHQAPAQSIGLDRDGSILISFDEAGLWRFNGKWEQVWDEGLPYDQPLTIFRDSDRRVWLGYANGGVVMIDTSGFHNFPSQQTGDLGNVLTFANTRDRLWAAGTNGLAYFEEGSFHRVSLRKEGILRGISGVVEDESGNLWLNASSGIVRVAAEQLKKAIAFSSTMMDYDLLDERQGLLGTATQIKPTPSAASDKSGLLWFSTSGHVFSISPGSVSLRQSTPVTIIQNVSINGVSVMDREHVLSKIKSSANVLNELEIDYIGIDLGSPEKVSYKYMLEGEDEEWHEVGSRRQAFYTHLGPGSYRFRVLSTNGRDQWCELVTPLLITITPAFYQTRWFYAICTLTVLVLLYLLYLLRVRHVTNGLKERMKERSGERLRIARELHDTLLQSVHGLMLRVHFATEALPTDEPARESLHLALSRADEVMLEGRRRVQDLREEVPECAELALQIARVAEELDIQKSMNFKIIEDGQRKELDPFVQRELYSIAREALTNTVYHSKAASAEISLIYANSYFFMKCCDTGIGLESSILTNGQRIGHWGLVGMRERASAIQGKIQLWSSPGTGTEIEIRVPARRAYRFPNTRMAWLQRLLQLRRDAEGRESNSQEKS